MFFKFKVYAGPRCPVLRDAAQRSFHFEPSRVGAPAYGAEFGSEGSALLLPEA